MKKFMLGIGIAVVVALVMWTVFRPQEIIDPIPVAKQLLVEAEIPVPQYDIKLWDKRPAGVSLGAEGWVWTGSTVINIPTYTDTYKDASRGSREAVIKLASIIVHEGVHAAGNSREFDAYNAQLAALAQMDAPCSVLEGVHQAKKVITGTR